MYDPYGAQQTEQQISNKDILTDFATYPIRPSSYFSMATLYPGMWSPSKGVRVPWIGKRWGEGRMSSLGQDMVNSFRGTYTKGVGTAIKGTLVGGGRFIKNAFTMGMTEKGGGGFVLPKNTPWNSENVERRAYDKALKLTTGFYNKYPTKSPYSVVKDARRILDDTKSGKSFTMLRSSAPAKGILGIQGIGKTVDLKEIKKIYSRASAIKTGGKIALGGMKALSYVGLASLAWDLGSMVAKPLAQAGMNALNNVAMEYQQRFMPEMGGQLALSYLSQGAATERQRAVNAISKSYINGRGAMGSEASYMHQ
jgi:hypothetical protein